MKPDKAGRDAALRVYLVAVLSAAAGIVEYWGRRNVAGPLLMPASRHLVTHWNEGIRVRKKIL